jgi:AraC-like DNA-binding protein
VRARKVVEEHLSEPDFSVVKFSRELGVSHPHLLRKLKALTGLTPQAFIRTHRLQRAAKFLEDGYGNVTEVAYAVGLLSLSTFAKRFREQYGVLPSEYPPQRVDDDA